MHNAQRLLSSVLALARSKAQLLTRTGLILALGWGLLGLARPAFGGYIDLTTAGASDTINGAIFTQGATLSGTGVFPAFVQVAGGGSPAIHEAYNTTVNNVYENGSSGTFNHEIQVSQLPIVWIGPNSYYNLFLDINESNNESDKFLSLDMLAIYTSATPNQSIEPATPPIPPLGTVRYDMGAGNGVLLNYDLETGSGRADLSLLIPIWASPVATDYVYVYSKFGVLGTSPPSGAPAGNYGNSDGFEEWALGIASGSPPTPVPEPASALLLGIGAAGMGAFYRRRRQTRSVRA